MIITNFLKLNQSGDTIVEVLICLAVLSLSLGISYASASGGVNQSLNAQEHSQALGILDAQVEDLRTAIENGVSISTGSTGFFCMTGPKSSSSTNLSVSPNANSDDLSTSEYGSCKASYYYYSISSANLGLTYGYTTPLPSISSSCAGGGPVMDESSYTFMIRWDGIGSLGRQQESLTYRMGASTCSADYVQPT